MKTNLSLLKYYYYCTEDTDIKNLLTLCDFVNNRASATIDAFLVFDKLEMGLDGLKDALDEGTVGFYIDQFSHMITDIFPNNLSYKNYLKKYSQKIANLCMTVDLSIIAECFENSSHADVIETFTDEKERLALFSLVDTLTFPSDETAKAYVDICTRRWEDILYFMYDEYVLAGSARSDLLKKSILEGNGDKYLDEYFSKIKNKRKDSFIRYISFLEKKYQSYGKDMLISSGLISKNK